MKIQILLETKDFLIINKPAGIMVHSDGKSTEPTVADWVVENFPLVKGVGESMIVNGTGGEKMIIDRPGIVHRLDRDTSGCLVIAKTQDAFEYLKKLFQDHAIQKTYAAFVYGHVPKDSGIIDAPIGRSSKDFRMYSSSRGKRGTVRPAVTNFETVTRFVDGTQEPFSYMKLSPKTGRTHQLRVHMKYLNHPIVSDPLYAASRPQALGFARQALHAESISFQGPDGSEIMVRAPYPDDFESAFEKFSIRP